MLPSRNRPTSSSPISPATPASSRGRARPRAGHHRRSHGHGGQGDATALSPRQVRGRRRFVYAVTAKVDGSILQDTIRSAYFKFRRRLRDIKSSLDLRVPSLRRDGRSRFQVRRPSRRDGEAEDGRARRACWTRRDSRPPAAQEHGKREDRRPRLCALQRRLPSARWASTRQRKVSSSITKPSTLSATSRSGCAISRRRGGRKTRRPERR